MLLLFLVTQLFWAAFGKILVSAPPPPQKKHSINHVGGLSCDMRPTNTQQAGATTRGPAVELGEQFWMLDLVTLSVSVPNRSDRIFFSKNKKQKTIFIPLVHTIPTDSSMMDAWHKLIEQWELVCITFFFMNNSLTFSCITLDQHLPGHLHPVVLHSPTSLAPQRWAAVILLHWAGCRATSRTRPYSRMRHPPSAVCLCVFITCRGLQEKWSTIMTRC